MQLQQRNKNKTHKHKKIVSEPGKYAYERYNYYYAKLETRSGGSDSVMCTWSEILRGSLLY